MLPTDKEECGEQSKRENGPKMRLARLAGGWLIRDHGKNLDLILRALGSPNSSHGEVNERLYTRSGMITFLYFEKIIFRWRQKRKEARVEAWEPIRRLL